MDTVCLLMHGLGGTSFDLKWVEAALTRAGIATRVLTLPGHGGSVEAYGAARFADWAAYAEREYQELAAQGKRVIVGGFSLGGILALHLAERFPVAGVMVLASPMFLCKLHPYFAPDPRLFFFPLLALWRKVEYHSKRSELAKETAPWEGHEGIVFPPQVVDLLRGMVAVRKKLSQVSAPLLFVQARGDKTCNMYNARYIAKNVSSKDVRLRFVSIAETRVDQHLCVTHQESREQVAQACAQFALDIVPKECEH